MLKSQLKLPGNRVRTGGSEGEPARPERGWEEAEGRQQAAGLPEADGPLALSPSSPRPLPIFPGPLSLEAQKCVQVPINCLCPHLLGDASGRLGRRENLFPDPIQRRGLPVRDLHSHRRHRLQGEVAAGSASQQ